MFPSYQPCLTKERSIVLSDSTFDCNARDIRSPMNMHDVDFVGRATGSQPPATRRWSRDRSRAVGNTVGARVRDDR